MASINPYEELARVLDTIPNGYPAVEDGTHIKILEWIFTPEEAELASKLKLSGETAAEIVKECNLLKRKRERITITNKNERHILSLGFGKQGRKRLSPDRL